MTKQELELGKFYQYPFSSTLYPLVEEKGEWKAIKANVPFVLLDVMIPEGFTGEVLKVLTKDGTIGFIGFSKDFIKKTKLVDKT